MYYETLDQYMEAKYPQWWACEHPAHQINEVIDAWNSGGQGAVSAIMFERLS